MSEKYNQYVAADYQSWYSKGVIARPFKGGKVTSEKEIDARCDALEADVNAYGDWLIQEQRKAEQAAYEQRKARREAKMNAQKPVVGSLGEILKSALK